MVFIFLAYFTLYNGLQFHLDAHQQTNGQGSCGTYTPWNINQPSGLFLQTLIVKFKCVVYIIC